MSQLFDNTAFDQAYGKLNKKQKEAVDHLYGPVLVVAGPGTGKTELLAVRIGNILTKGIDVQSHNILCLTFTEAGVTAMRNRLLKYIGPEAYSVSIHTYHSFCNRVIQENLEEFGAYRDLQLISDLERIETVHAMLDDLPVDHPLKRFKTARYYDAPALIKLFDLIKKENWTIEEIEQAYHDQAKNFREDEKMYYKRATKDAAKGDFKQKDFDKAMAAYEKGVAGARMLSTYEENLRRNERFDYQDMILWVLRKFQEDEYLLSKYQERYQFILLDEYQDTNGSQNDLVFQLTAFWEDPNIFAVGDDDQAIYRFQGANIQNITEFISRFKPHIIFLEDNYRSNQAILDHSLKLIEKNKERIILADQAKNLKAQSPKTPLEKIPVEVCCYNNSLQEEVGLVNSIEALHLSGVAYEDIAVLYRNNKEVNDLVRYFTRREIPINLRRKIDVLSVPVIQELLNILSFLQGELVLPHSESKRLFQLLHYPYFNISPLNVARISVFCSRRTDELSDDTQWREVITQEPTMSNIGVSQPQEVANIGNRIESWIAAAMTKTLQVLVEQVAVESGWLDHLLASSDRVFHLQAFNTLLNLVKNDSDRNRHFTLEQFLSNITKMEENRIILPMVEQIRDQRGINFITAHSSKGLEYNHVFLIKAQYDNWIKSGGRSSHIKVGSSLVKEKDRENMEDERRLFYVAMTRAKKTLSISYALQNAQEKEIEAARFVYEILGREELSQSPKDVPESDIENYLISTLQRSGSLVPLVDPALVDEVLESFSFSTTSLNKYLRCPISFYYESILRVPMARLPSLGFGNAVHYALEMYFSMVNNLLEKGPLPEVNTLLKFFSKGMDRYHSHFTPTEFANYSMHGNKILEEYYSEYNSRWLLPRKYLLEHSIDEVAIDGIPIKGKLDKMVFYDDHIEIVDYKTGKFHAAKLKAPKSVDDNGGDYWRQVVFYKILLSKDVKNGYAFSRGTMDFIEKSNDRYHRVSVPVTDADVDIVREQLQSSYNSIKNYKFTGCGEEDCRWCAFTSQQKSLVAPLLQELEE